MSMEDSFNDELAPVLKSGGQVFGAYTLTEKVSYDWGREVWLAAEDKEKRNVLLVFLPAELVADGSSLRQIQKEVNACQELDHPNLVKVYALVQDDWDAAVAVEHVKGKPVSELCSDAKGSHLEVKPITTWVAQLCHALSYAHRKLKAPHQAICPANVLVSPSGKVKLACFGLSLLQPHVSLPHHSPQQAQNQPAAISDDLYGLGSTLYEVLTSKPPFYEGEINDDLQNKVPPRMEMRRKELGVKGKPIPAKWESGVAACLAKNARSRPSSVAEFAETLGLPATDSVKPPCAVDASTRKLKWILIPVLAIVGLLLIGGTVWVGGIIWAEMQRQAEIKRVEAEKKKQEEAVRAAELLAEKERLKKEQEEREKQLEAERLKEQEAKRQEKEAERLLSARGTLQLETDPSGAIVTLKGQPELETPAVFESVKLGAHAITIEKGGYETMQRQVEIFENKVTNLGTIRLIRATGDILINSKPGGATVFFQGEKVGKTPLTLKEKPTGVVFYQIKLEGYLPARVEGRIREDEPEQVMVELKQRAQPVPGEPWENDLGMKFNPVPGLDVLFGVHEVRVSDFETFVAETGHNAKGGMRSLKDSRWGQHGHNWKDPGFQQKENHPVVGVSWKDAKAFCKWLTERDRFRGILAQNQSYRLPTDSEWSIAVGLREDSAGTPEQKNGKNTVQYPWGTQWPPPERIGNYAGVEVKQSNWPKDWITLQQHRDQFPKTAPAGSSSLRLYGLRDMGGNVWEWCENRYKTGEVWRVLRGGGWNTNRPEHLLSSHREYYGPDDRYSFIGFRCVLAN